MPQALPPFKDFVHLYRNKLKLEPFAGDLVCFDPGGTTGYAIFNNLELKHQGQIDTSDRRTSSHRFMEVAGLIEDWSNVRVVIEEYRIYGWKADDHTWSDLHTAKIIGQIEALTSLRDIPLFVQGAQQAKSFASDDKLKDWGFWIKGQRHARDAIRHGIHHLIFVDPKAEELKVDLRGRDTGGGNPQK